MNKEKLEKILLNIENILLKNEFKDFDVVDIIIQTKEYDKFKSYPTNREIEEYHVNELMESMAKNLYPTEVTINENGEIVDGQHRFMALKKLGFPIRTKIVIGGNDKYIQTINSETENWKHNNYLNHYIKNNIEVYKIFKSVLNEYQINFSDLILVIDTFNNINIGEKKLIRNFDKGELIIDDMINVIKFLDTLKFFKEFSFYKQSYFLRAFLKLYLCDIFDELELKRRLKINEENLKLKKQNGSINTFGKLLENLYNDNKRNKEKVYYDEETQEFGVLQTPRRRKL